jgi:hypothetical protein
MDELITPVLVRYQQESLTIKGGKEEQHETGEEESAVDESSDTGICMQSPVELNS